MEPSSKIYVIYSRESQTQPGTRTQRVTTARYVYSKGSHSKVRVLKG